MGVLLHIMLSGLIPFLSLDNRMTAFNIVKGRINLDHANFAGVTREGKELIRRMFDIN